MMMLMCMVGSVGDVQVRVVNGRWTAVGWSGGTIFR